jgi:histidine triad (HIT) family protein
MEFLPFMKCIRTLLRNRIARLGLSFFFAHASFALPVNCLCQTGTLIAFHHPHPLYPVHILLVPKLALSGLMDLSSDHRDFLVDLFLTVQSLVIELNLEEQGYRLIANGGKYQEVPQLHFHLVSGPANMQKG